MFPLLNAAYVKYDLFSFFSNKPHFFQVNSLIQSAKNHRNFQIELFFNTVVKTFRAEGHTFQFTFIEADIQVFKMRIT